MPVFRRLFDRLPVRISTSDLHHRILRKKLYHIRAYDFGVQFSFKFTLRSLTQVTVLHFGLRLSFCQTHDFLKNSSISHPATVFLFRNLSCIRNLIKPHCFGEENEKIFPGAQPPNVGKYQNGTSYTRVSARHK